MARDYLILSAGRHQRSAWETLCDDYRRRIGRLATVRDQRLKAKTAGSATDRCRAEGQMLLGASPDPSWGIALDSGGKALSSEELAAQLERLEQDWPHPVVFYLGSDLGLAPEVLSRARQVLSFGPMTLSHDLARVVLYEQLYRALSISAGINYHRPRL